MDIRCPKCGEPWDVECLHEEVEDRIAQGTLPKPDITGYHSYGYGQPAPLYDTAQYGKLYDAVRGDFYRRGCPALYGAKCANTAADPGVAMLYDLLGDDLDGAAAMMEDFGLAYE